MFERGVLFCVMCVICVLCLIEVPLPPDKKTFAVKINNKIIIIQLISLLFTCRVNSCTANLFHVDVKGVELQE
jgi:hypothetical protein